MAEYAYDIMERPTNATPPSPQGDDWHGVLDPKKRKQIQDRLAQRARRRRLADTKSSQSCHTWRTRRSKQPLQTTRYVNQLSEVDNYHTNQATILEPLRCHNPPTSNQLLSPPKEQTFLSAIFENGNILGIKCGISFPSKSRPTGREVPVSLQPTLLQLSMVHWQWIDRLPFSDARDEIIIQSGNINEEEFLWDVFNMPTFVLKPGAKCWDPNAYMICPEFKTKWGFLFPSFA